MAEPSPDPGDAPEAGNKRSQSDLETTAPDPNIKEEPDTKKQKLEGIAAPAQQPLNIIDIDPAGDLLLSSSFGASAFKVDSSAIKRAAPSFYKKCFAARPLDDSAWTVKVIALTSGGSKMILDIVHGNLDMIPHSINCVDVHNAVVFAKRYEFMDRFSGCLKQWYQLIRPNCCHSSMVKACNCARLWIAYHLGLKEEFQSLQAWAIFHLSDDGKGDLGDLVEQFSGKALVLSNFYLREQVVINRLIRLRSEAINLIITSLTEVQLALIPSGQFGKDGRINNKFGGCACANCLDTWLGCLTRSLLRPASSGFVGRDLPCLSPAIEAKEYRQPLEKLCAFVDALQLKMHKYPACIKKGKGACSPPQLVGRKAVEDLINRGLQAPLSAT